jgi:hypothetical protein
MEIVSAEPADAAPLGNLHRLTWEATYRDYAGERWYGRQVAAHALRDWEEVIRKQVASGGGVLIAKRDEAIVGFCQFGLAEDENSDRTGHIHRLYVLPANQRTSEAASGARCSARRSSDFARPARTPRPSGYLRAIGARGLSTSG